MNGNLNGLGNSPQAIAQAQVQELLQKRFEAKMMEQTFPAEHIPPGWHDWKNQAMKHVAPLSQGLSGEDFMFIYASQPGHPINLFWFGTANNIIQTSSFEQLKSGFMYVQDGDVTIEMNSMSAYCKIMDITTTVSKIWSGIVADLRTQVKDEWTEEQAQLQKKAGKTQNNLRAN